MMPHNNQPQLRPRTAIPSASNKQRKSKPQSQNQSPQINIGESKKNGIIAVSSWPKSRFDCHKKGQQKSKEHKKPGNPAVFNTLGTINYMAGKKSKS